MSRVINISEPNDIASIKIIADKIINRLTNFRDEIKHNKMNLVCSVILIKKPQLRSSTYDDYLVIVNHMVNKKMIDTITGLPVLIQYTNFQTSNNSQIQFVIETKDNSIE